MKKLALLSFLFFISTAWAFADMPMQPPERNPNPPQSAEDKRRIDFAVQQIRAKFGSQMEIQRPHIVPGSAEIAHSMSKPNKYIVHAFVKGPNNTTWRHLNVALSEDKSGKLLSEGIYDTIAPPC